MRKLFCPPYVSLLSMNMYRFVCSKSSLPTLILASLVASLMSGCALTPSAESGLEELTGTQSTNGIYVVEYKVPQKKSEMQKFPLSEGVTVQQALEKSGLVKKAGSCELLLIRTIPGTQRRHKMKLDYISRKRQVSPEHDYMLHADDHLVVARASHNPLEAMFPGALTSR